MPSLKRSKRHQKQFLTMFEGGIMGVEKDVENICERYYGGVEYDPHRLGMAGATAAHLLVTRIYDTAAD